jgi:serine/threonine protein kinase
VTGTIARKRWGFDGTSIAPGRVTLRRLGGGGEFEVYLVWDEGLRAAVAAKLVRRDRMGEAKTLRRLQREADLLERLVHPGLAACIGRAFDADVPHLLLEHLDGPPLRSVLRERGALRAEQVVPVAAAIAGVLDHLATTGHVHLDVKPGNIVLTPVPKLIDLSLARTLAAAADLRGVAGTAPYLSPEQCLAGRAPADDPTVGSPADVWGLGITMHEALTGARPFPKVAWKTVPATRYPQVLSPPEPLPHHVAPTFVVDLVHACLARNPADRPTAAEVRAALLR